MLYTPLLTSHSAQQQRPLSQWSAAVALFEAALFGAKGVSARFRNNLLRDTVLHTGVFVTGMIKTLAELLIDRPTQSGWCRRDVAPR